MRCLRCCKITDSWPIQFLLLHSGEFNARDCLRDGSWDPNWRIHHASSRYPSWNGYHSEFLVLLGKNQPRTTQSIKKPRTLLVARNSVCRPCHSRGSRAIIPLRSPMQGEEQFHNLFVDCFTATGTRYTHKRVPTHSFVPSFYPHIQNFFVSFLLVQNGVHALKSPPKTRSLPLSLPSLCAGVVCVGRIIRGWDDGSAGTVHIS